MRTLVIMGLAALVVLVGARAAADTSPVAGEEVRRHADARRFGDPGQPGPHRVFRRPPRRFDDARRRQVDRPAAGLPQVPSGAPGPTPFGAGGPTPFGAGGSAPFGAGGSPP
ncbi:MAG TPA: hypothetical protein VF406_17675 [Thermodesulfobacteriota bacterium]